MSEPKCRNRFALAVIIAGTISTATAQDVPQHFPQIAVPGYEEKMDALRRVYHQVFQRTGLGATLWDEWLVPAYVMPVGTDGARSAKTERVRTTLNKRNIDTEGYVSTHQHASIAHQTGWPFPFWNQGRTGFGFHFSYYNTVGSNWRSDWIVKAEDWNSTGVTSLGVSPYGWEMKLAPGAMIAPPDHAPVDPWNSPFVQLRWKVEGPGELREPYLEWKRDDMADFARTERIYLPPPEKSDKLTYTMAPLYRHPGWRGTIKEMRIGFNNDVETSVALQAFFAQYDTRHPINNTSYLTGANDYFSWTGDVDFLRQNMNRMRMALAWMESEFDIETSGIVKLDWVGHDGRTGLYVKDDGTTDSISGNGIGNNYWDLLPVGGYDGYATMRYVKALEILADLERAVADNPAWNIPTSPLTRSPEEHLKRAEISRAAASKFFWNEENGRFLLSEDLEGGRFDYGFTFMNLEAICYGLATSEQARSIMDWLDGKRIVADDTSTGEDIYFWDFAPRATTKRNVLWYQWVWSGPHTIGWGDQVQDGGAVLGFSYHDILARLKVNGPDDAWKRLDRILQWMVDVEAEGGPRQYYDGRKRPGTMQGNGVAGGLGIDAEFYETILIPMTVLDGFLGWRPLPDGVRMHPQLPEAWPSVAVRPMQFRGEILELKATSNTVTLQRKSNDLVDSWRVELPADSSWTLAEGTSASLEPITDSKPLDAAYKAYRFDWKDATEITLNYTLAATGVAQRQ